MTKRVINYLGHEFYKQKCKIITNKIVNIDFGMDSYTYICKKCGYENWAIDSLIENQDSKPKMFSCDEMIIKNILE